jgi:hypothetical protein
MKKTIAGGGSTLSDVGTAARETRGFAARRAKNCGIRFQTNRWRKRFMVLAVSAVLGIGAGCTSTITRPVDATNNPIGSKVGKQSETVHFVWIFSSGYTIDASAYKAARNGGITRIATVDIQEKREWKFSRFFPLFMDLTITTIVTGE